MLFFLLLICAGSYLCTPVWGQFVFTSPSDPEDALEIPPLGGVLSPTLRDDQLEMFLESTGDIWRATRGFTTIPFKEAFRVSGISTTGFVEERPFLSPDGLRIYFTRRAAGEARKREIYYASRPDLKTPFGQAVSLGPDGGFPFEGVVGSLTGDELTIYLEAFPKPDGKQIPDQTDIAVATRSSVGNRFGAWRYLDEVNTQDLETGPYVTRDGHTLFFSRLKRGLPSVILSATRSSTTVPFSPPVLVKGVNVANSSSRDPFVVHPGARMFFVYDQAIVFSDRILDATYRIDPVRAIPGREFRIPIGMDTLEKDATFFRFDLYFDPLAFVWLGALPNERLGQVMISAALSTPAIVSVTYQAAVPLRGQGEKEEVLNLKFSATQTTPPGQRDYGFVGETSLNGIPLSESPTSFVNILEKPTHPPTSRWVVR